LSLFISFATGGSTFQEPAKTSSSDLNRYLEKGDVEKVIVYNKAEAEVYLTAAALKILPTKPLQKIC
jgi:cell division protease FtsH